MDAAPGRVSYANRPHGPVTQFSNASFVAALDYYSHNEQKTQEISGLTSGEMGEVPDYANITTRVTYSKMSVKEPPELEGIVSFKIRDTS